MDTETRIPLNTEPGFVGADLPTDEDLYRCVHCGLCLSACPTYVELNLETESPRGRIALMKAVKEGRLGISQRVAQHWELCLQCRACEAVCPSGVPFGRLMEYTRSQLQRRSKESWRLRLIRAFFLRGALPHLTRLRSGARLLGFYQRWGFQGLVRKSRLLALLPGSVAQIESGLPSFTAPFFGPTVRVYPALGERRMSVGLLSGCIMPLAQGPTMRATVRVLTRNGCDVTVPVGQGCCGALNLHSGDAHMARRMARRNIDIFLNAGVEKVIVASAGCGSTMKEYGDLLKDDPAYRDRAETLGGMTQDVTEFLAGLPFDPPRGEIRRHITYQDSCHLAHAQRITQAPRSILSSIPGVRFDEMDNASRCCGAAGIYSITQREMSRRLLESKMEAVAATGAETVVTANPGCVIQLEAGMRAVGISGRVCHVVDLLDESYRAEE